MGCTQSTSNATAAKTATTPKKDDATTPAQEQALDVVEVELKKHRPQCNGMFWRGDPRPEGEKLESNNHWPKDNARLRGTVVFHDDEKWLLCTQVQQKGENVWHNAPKGAAMPFVYSDHYYLE